ncbi:MAG: TonB-dependent receptor, partial [Candidatus Acidiferrales bacterium]
IKNKLFFFGDYERNTQRQNAFVNQLIPDSSMYALSTVGGVQGIQLPTSYLSGSTTVPVAIYNPMTGAANGTGRTQFANNFIPLTQISPAALSYLNVLKGAATPFALFNPALSYNYVNNADGDYTVDDIDSKFTYLPTSKSTIFGRYSISLADILDPPALGVAGGNATNGGQQGNSLSRIQVLGLGGTYAFTPSFIMDGNFGYTRQKLGALNLDNVAGDNFGIAEGIPGANGGTLLQAGYPAFTLSGFANMGDPNTANPFLFRDNEYTGDVNFSWQKSTHAIRFGYEQIHWGLNHFQPEGGNIQTGRGGFGFNGNMTSNGTSAGITDYNSFADFLLGLPDQTGKASDTLIPNTERESTYSWYGQDTWQATQKLTVSYGARVEWYPFMTEAPYEGHQEGIPVFNPATGQVIIGGNGSVPLRDGVKTPAQIVPRIGLAYRLTPKTVVRAGFGISVDPSNFRNLRDAYPSDALVQGNAPTTYNPAGLMGIPASGSGITCTGVTNTSTCSYGPYNGTLALPLGVPSLPTFNITSGSIPLPNANTTTVPLDYRRGYIESYNLTVQRDLGAGFNFQIAYVRTLGIREQAYYNLNWSNPGAGQDGQMNLAFPTQLTSAGLTINSQCGCGSSNYNAMQTELTRKLGHGGFIGVNYTWSHTIDEVNNANTNYADSGFFFTAPAYFYRNRATSGYDQTNNLEIYGAEPSPFGKDGEWMQHGFGGKILGGWLLSEVLTKASGFPFTVSGNANSLNSTGNSQTANMLSNIQFYNNPGPPPGVTCTNSNPACTYFNPADFYSVVACNAAGAVAGNCGAVFGDTGRDEFRGPGLFNLDMSLGREFPIHEQIKLFIEIQAVSLTNTPHFANPSSTTALTVGNPGSFGQITGTLASSGSNTSSISSGARAVFATARFSF